MFEKNLFEKKRPAADRNTSNKKTNETGLYWPVQQSAPLLAATHRRKFLEPLQELTGLEELSEFRELCEPVLDNLAKFIQELPYTEKGIFSHRGGLLDFILDRTHSVMSISRSYFLPVGSELVSLTLPQQLWAYAVLTATLLKDLGYVALQYEVSLFDKDKNNQGLWHPFEGSMLKQNAALYQYRFLENKAESVLQETTILLAKNFLPLKGFEWIASNPQIFEIWLAMLRGDIIGSGTFGPIFLRAEALVLQRYLEGFSGEAVRAELGRGLFTDLLKKEDSSKDISAKNKKQALAKTIKAFLDWMKKHIREGHLSLGEGDLKTDKGTLLLTDERLKTFEKETGIDWQATKKAMLTSNIAFLANKTGEKVSTMQIENAAKYPDGIVLSNLFLTLPAGQTALQNAKKMPTQYIASNGQLVNANKSAPPRGAKAHTTFGLSKQKNIPPEEQPSIHPLQPGQTKV